MKEQRYPFLADATDEELEAVDAANRAAGMPRIFSDEFLRAAGAYDCPPEWRKSLSDSPKKKKKEPERDLFSDLVDDDDPPAAMQADEEIESDDDVELDDDVESDDEDSADDDSEE